MSECPECGRSTVTAGACTPDCGYVQHEAVAILQDLIAESRAWLAGEYHEPLVWMLNRAERRLREVEDE